MCLGVPGRVARIERNALGLTMGTVDFGGIRKEVCLACTPEVSVGDYVLVHVGFSISTIDEEEAREVFRMLAEMGEPGDPGAPGPPAEAA
jgi:hydrogenase expression/formation protein HypC